MKLKVGLVQESPVFFNKKESLEKLERLVKTQSKEGCKLLVFPESFIPGYPRGLLFGTTIGNRSDEGRSLYLEYYENSVDTEGEEVRKLEEIASNYGVYLVIGVTEKNTAHGSLYCSMLYFSPKTGFLGSHKKIKPTGAERVIWAEADGTSLTTFQTEIGKLGGLICWENYMPLARMSMFSKGIEIYIAPTADARTEWISTMQHIALEGRCFVLACNQFFTKSMYPERFRPLLKNEPEMMCRGGSLIVAPDGKILAGPLYNQSGIVTATLDLDDVIKNKLDFDVNGHYSRKDIFTFSVKGQPNTIKE